MRPDKRKNRGRGRGRGSVTQANVEEVNVVHPSSSCVDVTQNQQVEQIQKAEADSEKIPKHEIASESEENLASKSYSRRKVFSNWERYAEPERANEPEDEEENDGVDFQNLLQAPASGNIV